MQSTWKNSVSKTHIIAIELIGLITLYVVIIWLLIPNVLTSTLAFYAFYLLMGLAIVYYLYVSPFLIHGDTLEKRGLGTRDKFYLRTDNFYRAWWYLFTPLLFASSAIILAAWFKGSPFFIQPDWYGLSLKFSLYLFSAFAQDILFFSFLLVRLKDLISIRSDRLKYFVVIAIFATLFSLFHLPNLPVMVLSFFFASTLGYVFYKTPNLYVIVLAHAILGTLLHRVYELHMRMGMLYLDESKQGLLMRNLIPFIDEIIGNRW